MKKRLFISLLMLVMVSMLGGCQMETKYKTQEEQIEFLKKHEKQMTEYVKSYSEKIKTVTYNWSTTNIGQIGNGTLQGGGTIIRVRGVINNDDKLDFSIAVDSTLTDTESYIPETDIGFSSDISNLIVLKQGE